MRGAMRKRRGGTGASINVECGSCVADENATPNLCFSCDLIALQFSLCTRGSGNINMQSQGRR